MADKLSSSNHSELRTPDSAPGGRYLVTGASGFLGGFLVARLLERGERVVTLSHKAVVDPRPGLEVVAGDLLDPPSLAAAAASCRGVYHCAAEVHAWDTLADVLRQVNVEGTANLLKAALDAGAGRVVHVSTAAAIGEATGQTGDEETPHRGSFLNAYEESKHEAERVVAEFVSQGLDAVIVNPGYIYGPGDGKLDDLLGEGPQPLHFLLYPDSYLPLVYVDDVVSGLISAMERGRSGNRYILVGHNITYREYLRLVWEIAGRESQPELSEREARMVRRMAVLGMGRKWHTPEMSQAWFRTLEHGGRYSNHKSIRELGIRYSDLESTLRETIDEHRRRAGLQ